MKKVLTLLATALLAVTAWADTVTYSPTAEYNTRPKADGSAWSAMKVADETNVKFEITASACFSAVQQYTVADLANATSITLSLKGGSSDGTDALAIWAVDGTFTSDITAADFITIFNATTGMNPGTEGTTSADYLLKDKSSTKVTMTDGTNRECTFVINGTALATLKSKAEADGTVTLLITNNVTTLESNNSTSKRKYYSSGNEDESLRPTLTVVTEKPACQIGETGYATLAEAVAACPVVTEDNNEPTTIVINKDVEVSARINIQSQNVTIKGATGIEKILRKDTYKNGLMFLTKDTLATLTIENVILDGQSVEATAAVFESSNNGLTVLNNVTIQNAVATSTQGIFCNKNRGRAVLNGVTMTGCTASASKALVFVGTNNVTLSGTNNFGAIYVEKQNYITNDNAEGVQEIIVDETRTEGDLVLNGKVENYTVTGTSLPVNQKGKNVYLGEVVVETPACQIGETGYATLAEAVAACLTVTAEANEPTTIIINKDVEVSARINIQSQNVTIKGATGTEKILRKDTYKNGLMFLTKDTLATLTIENVIIDGQSVEATAAVFESSNKGLTVLNNVTIQNAVATSAQGIFCNKSYGRAILNGVTMTDCTAAISKALVFVGTSKVTLSGTNNFGAIYVQGQNYLINDNAEGVQEIIVDADREAGLLVKYADVENYTVTGSTLPLTQQEDNVWLGEKKVEVYGDVNGDGKVDISDVNSIITVICGGETNSKADVNGDNKIDVSDVNVVIGIICGE